MNDLSLMFVGRCLRLFAFGFLSLILVLRFESIGLSTQQSGLLLTLVAFGDMVIGLPLTSWADRFGRRRILLLSSLLMVLASVVFSLTNDFWWLVFAATVGVVSPGGNEAGPFLPVEQASIAQIVSPERRTGVFAWYNLAGSAATALGALCSGWICYLQRTQLGREGSQVFDPILLGYGVLGGALFLVFLRLSKAIEVASPSSNVPAWGVSKSRGVVARLAALFALDAFAGGFVVQSVLSYWLAQRFQAQEHTLGSLFFAANLLAAGSSLCAAALASRIGLLNAMVFTHLPSNVLLLLVPLMPSFAPAAVILLMRFSISQMDVPTRQSFVMAVVPPEERAAAAGITTTARMLGQALAYLPAMYLAGSVESAEWGLYLCGGLKIVYDLLLLAACRRTRLMST